MTQVKRGSMKVRRRYRAAYSKDSKYSRVVIVNAFFLVCFIIYHVMILKSNGGSEAGASTDRSFLKGGTPPRDTTYKVFMDDDPAGGNLPKIRVEEEQLREEGQIEKGQIANQQENEAKLEKAQIAMQHDPFSEENEVRFKKAQIAMQHDPFAKENEVDTESDILEGNGGGEQAPEVLADSNANELPIQGGSGPSYVFDPNHQMFHNYYKGKSGKVVEEMLIAHAYVFHQNATYGGCCGSRTSKMDAHEDLLDALGLKDVLRFRCPRDFVHDTVTKRSVIPQNTYLSQDTQVWTPEYVDYLRSLVTYPERRHKEYTIVVHMLRGNTSPCKEKNRGFHSYLPNLHYQNLIDKYMKPGARVIIYTSAKSFEDLSEFRNRGYEVNTGTSLKETWKEFVTADVFIMSRSDFSMVPAMVAKGTVVYTPFWHHTLRRWKRASKSIMRETDEETERLQNTQCVSN